jgi:hypothetical protein
VSGRPTPPQRPLRRRGARDDRMNVRGPAQNGRSDRLDDSSPAHKNEPPVVVLVEAPDPDGRRWQVALELLLEAGRTTMTSEAEADAPR